MHINWLIPINHNDYNRMPASIWIRCLQLIPYFEEQGIKCSVNDYNSNADISIFVRWQDENAYTLLQRFKNKQRIIFDLCVNYLHPAGDLGGYGSFDSQRDEVLKMIECSDAVTCASDYIWQCVKNIHSDVYYISDSIDNRHFKFKKNQRDFYKDKIALIYAGISVKTQYLLDNLYPIFKKRNVNLKLLTEKNPVWLSKIKYIKWRYDNFPKNLLTGEIGIAPRIVNNEYDKGHSIFKIGVFLAQGVPVLASPVPSYKELILGNNVGNLCSSLEEWEITLDNLLNNRDILLEWSQNSYNVIEPYYTKNIIKKYLSLFNKIL